MSGDRAATNERDAERPNDSAASMTGSFFDSNVLLYLASADAAKAVRAEVRIAEGGMVSVQVLNEIASVARRKMQLTWRETRDFLDLFRRLLTVVPVDLETHERGLAIAERYRLSVFDAMIAAAAIQGGCERLLSEDLQHGLVIDGRLTVENPFRAE